MPGNSNLHDSAKNKQDEFYTRLQLIEDELKHYRDHYEEKATDFKIDESGQKWRRMGNICWFTNLDMEKHHKELTLFKRYTPAEYPKYDNYDAIEVGKATDIPCDYEGAIRVPITFMQYHNPDQFEILGLDDHRVEWVGHGPLMNGKAKYRRIFIRRRREGVV